MKKGIILFLVTVLIIGTILTGCSPSEPTPTPAPEPAPVEKPVIKIGDLNWGSAHFQSELAKIIIEEGYGYPVELVSGKTIALFQSLMLNEIDIVLEIWEQSQQEAWDKGLASGDILDLGTMNDDNWQSLFTVPTYLIKGDAERGIEPMAPNLKSAFDLDQPEYKELFKNPENPGKGMILTCVPGWECEIINEDKLAVYELDDDYDLASPGSQETLFASMLKSYENGDPFLAYVWGPTWISGKLDLTVLEEPAFDQAKWDENHGCAYPATNLKIAVYKDIPEKAPDVAEMLKVWKLNTKTLGEALAFMDETGGEPIDAAIWHLKNKEEVWTKFVPADVAEKVKEAVASM